MSKVLVIHPQDESTDFLKLIYKGKGFDVINDGNYDVKKLREQINQHDKIIMMGHGTPGGLINPQYWGGWLLNTQYRPYVIDESFAELLSKKETISIWCNSDKFFGPRGIKGFHTGMIISECSEQQYVLGKVYLDSKEQLYNMLNFAQIIHNCIDETPEKMKEYILEHYNYNDEVTKFNRDNIIVL